MKPKKVALFLTILLSLSILVGACTQATPEPTKKPTEPVKVEEPIATETPMETEAPAETEPPVVPIVPGGPPNVIKPAPEIVLYNWSENIDPEVYTLFEEEFGIRVIEANFLSNVELMASMQGGASSYALIVPSDSTVAIMIEQGMLAELDPDRVPNMMNLGERFMDPAYDPGNRHCVPYQWGAIGLGYINGEVVPPSSWDVLFEPDPESPAYGRTTMLDDARKSFAAALAYLGYDINSTDETQLREAKDLLVKAKAGLAGYDSGTYGDLLASGENLLAHGWNVDFKVARELNGNIAFAVPQEGGVLWANAVCIPNTVSDEQKVAGEIFINFILRPDIAAMISVYNRYASPNTAAEDYLDEEFLSDPMVFPPPDVLARLQFLRPVGEAESLYQRLWDEIKSAQ